LAIKLRQPKEKEMTKQKNPKDLKDPRDPKHPQDPNEPCLDGEEPKHKPEGREHQVHKEILERRMRGGPAPTPDAYTRALEQWKNLPGSIVRPPTDITPPPAEESSEPIEPADQGGSSPSKPDTDDQNDKEHQP
jgi:hypothetical protein